MAALTTTHAYLPENGISAMPVPGPYPYCPGGGNGSSCSAPPDPYPAAAGPASPPQPSPSTGILAVDPEAMLLAKKFDLALDFNYQSGNNYDQEWGQSRAASVHARIFSATSGTTVTMMQGDLNQQVFSKVGTSGTVTTYQAVADTGTTTSLSFDSSVSLFTQYLNDGTQMQYKAQVSGSHPVTYPLYAVVDASGVQQSYLYDANALLQSIH